MSDLPRLDWNICYVGRTGKLYINKIFDDVCAFAQAHQDRAILFVFLDKLGNYEQGFRNKAGKCKNLTLVSLGGLSPIPRALYAKVDVVIAGAGSAWCSAYEGVPTIIADSENMYANGIYGIDTFDVFKHEDGIEQKNYNDVLEDLLVNGKYRGKKIRLPYRKRPEEYYQEQLDNVYQSCNELRYYVNFPKFKLSVTIEKSLKDYVLHKYFPAVVLAKRKIATYIKGKAFN